MNQILRVRCGAVAAAATAWTTSALMGHVECKEWSTSVPLPEDELRRVRKLYDSRSLAGWQGHAGRFWNSKSGEIVGASPGGGGLLHVLCMSRLSDTRPLSSQVVIQEGILLHPRTCRRRPATETFGCCSNARSVVVAAFTVGLGFGVLRTATKKRSTATKATL